MALAHPVSGPMRSRGVILFGLILSLITALAPEAALAAAKVTVAKAAWSSKTGLLTVKGNAKNASGGVEIYDLAGRLLGSSPKSSFALSLSLDSALPIPCAVRVQAAGAEAIKAVLGGPKDCAKAPLCQIATPAQGVAVSANTDVGFAATATLKDKTAGPLTLEWDFAGGSMGEAIPNTHPTAWKRPDTANTTVQFVRDNASYRVRFTAWDKKNRYCEDSVLVQVGSPPSGLPDMSAMSRQAQDGAPKSGGQLAGNPGEVVVMPFTELTMPGTGDYRFTPNVEVLTGQGVFSTLNAVVYRKDRLPVVLDDTQVALKYSASSNPDDPVGEDSINSTSQNWPLNSDTTKPAPLLGAAIQKTDLWQAYDRPASDPRTSSYFSWSWLTQSSPFKGRQSAPDEGLILTLNPDDATNAIPGDRKGRYMPGKSNPYTENTPQDFTSFWKNAQQHIARAIPLTDIDDAGRVNPFPVLRVDAVDKNSGQTLATADTVMTAAKDLHCRECHAKGKIGANDKFDWNSIPEAHHSSAFYGKRACAAPAPFCTDTFSPPAFYDAVDSQGHPSDNLFDQEFAANQNISSLHDFYDNTEEVAARNGFPNLKGERQRDPVRPCVFCHRSRINGEMFGNSIGRILNFPGFRGAGQPTDSAATQSEVMHSFHQQLQLDPGDPGKILRDGIGRPKLWDPAAGANPNTLFPTVDAQGNALPMEQNCLRCHGGHREQQYRDRMYTAGVTCYDCHGDMSAVGSAHAKPQPGTSGTPTRIGWYEQPDCGSCHIGNANQGKAGTNGFYSAGVMRRAFDTADLAATTRPPKTPRFAVQHGEPFPMWSIDGEVLGLEKYNYRYFIKTLDVPLYRRSKDTHGNVACAACHGGAHEVWPNRDPKASDNLTAVQLQGHTGTILECNVCHTADSFKNEADLDGGVYSGDAKPGILGGPHNTHPINDAYWWKSTAGDAPNADGTTYGGWHNNYAKKAGELGEDQCAACHGNDHKGTRLSKTPVDRIFDFSGFDQKKLKKAGFKSKVVKVAAGTQIGCDTCHSIQTSCIGSPAGGQCGGASEFVPVRPTNKPPVITSTPGATTGVMGQPYSYQVTATDPDGDSLTFSLGARPSNPQDAIKIDAASGLVTGTWPQSVFSGFASGPYTFPYTVTVSDGKGGHATQTVTMTLQPPAAP